MFDNVVVGVHESEAATAAVSKAMEVARASGGTLHLVMAYSGKHLAQAPLPAEFRYAVSAGHPVDQLLEKLATAANEQSIRVVTHPVTAAPAEAIAMVADDERADLIVVGQDARHRGRRRTGVHAELVSRASCAILVV